ncbi:MAG: CoA activase [Polyangiaceae bacterium]|nr:CoA activase [Polyangiaceae bacterium]
MAKRYVGIDIGAETVKLVELERRGAELMWTRRALYEHHKEPGAVVTRALADWDFAGVAGAAVAGRLGRLVDLPRVPGKRAQAAGFAWRHGPGTATIVSIGSHGFSVLELRPSGAEVLRENSRCSQGTGNFLRQLVERFDLDIAAASALAADVPDPAALSGRCPVILKTDMTHLANRGESRARILAGLYDAVCDNVQVLVKPEASPPAMLLIGGVMRAARVQASFRRFCERHGMTLLPYSDDDALFLEALGCAATAATSALRVPPLDRLLCAPEEAHLERLPALASYLPRVRRLPRRAAAPEALATDAPVILGFDIGSTGSKVVALDAARGEAAWDAYLYTNGDPVGAAQGLMRQFVASPLARRPVVGFGVTGSGREIVGSLLASTFGSERVYVLNEIAAHAEGALACDPRVDTIFEIGGQDAKYIRLAEGRVVDAAMNEACSAGTGSFIEEQGRKFAGIGSVAELGAEALCATGGVSLGQHCSVFMAEIIDEAVAAGVDNRAVIAGIYDSIVQNYLNRVKGSRPVGQVVFCQGMPFAADALAAAVARQTGSEVVVPPSPGIMGALGIALLCRKALPVADQAALAPARFLEATVVEKDTFVCKSTKGCGGAGNRCRIDRIATRVASERGRFTWGGGCSLWDGGTGKKKLPDRAPDPFREREALVHAIVRRVTTSRGRRRVAMTDEFQLKGTFPFFATLLYELGLDVTLVTSAGGKTLKRGIEKANVPFCAPMQHYHGLVSAMAAEDVAFVFAPMVREMPRVAKERHAVVCPIVQASPDLLRHDLGAVAGAKILSPVIDFGPENLDAAPLRAACEKLGAELGASPVTVAQALRRARHAQLAFDRQCLEIGRRALAFAVETGIVPVVVLGRPYTIYNDVLNSHVPPLLREQGALAIPVDCYPVADEVPGVEGMYWGQGQRNLRAAHQIRRMPGVYSLWCSNYSCGPDSFNLHFYAYAMAGKPFAIVETDGHSGDAGTKTRVEAFLHCVREHLAAEARAAEAGAAQELARIDRRVHGLREIRARGETLLVPRMGAGAEAMAACLRGIGVRAETLPLPDREALRLGRRHTSGKECLPMSITAGSLLARLAKEPDPKARFAFFMPTADGPCRFGAYNMLHRLILERVGQGERVSIWSPADSDYFEGVPGGFAALVMTGFAAFDVLQEALYDVRPVERTPGAADAIFERYRRELCRLLESAGSGDLSLPNAFVQAASGRLFGCADLLRRAGAELARARSGRRVPTVLVVGEIYVRCDPFANDFVIEKLERRGIRARFAPFSEWLEYSDWVTRLRGSRVGLSAELSSLVQRRIQNKTYAVMAAALGWHERTTVKDALDASSGYLRADLCGEAVLTLGGPIHEWRHGHIDGVVSVGPHECMPNKIAESQFFHVAEKEGLLSLTLPLNGDPIDPAILDTFAFDVKERFQRRRGEAAVAPPRPRAVEGERAEV